MVLQVIVAHQELVVQAVAQVQQELLQHQVHLQYQVHQEQVVQTVLQVQLQSQCDSSANYLQSINLKLVNLEQLHSA